MWIFQILDILSKPFSILNILVPFGLIIFLQFQEWLAAIKTTLLNLGKAYSILT